MSLHGFFGEKVIQEARMGDQGTVIKVEDFKLKIVPPNRDFLSPQPMNSMQREPQMVLGGGGDANVTLDENPLRGEEVVVNELQCFYF